MKYFDIYKERNCTDTVQGRARQNQNFTGGTKCCLTFTHLICLKHKKMFLKYYQAISNRERKA